MSIIPMIREQIYTKLTVEGTHNWPDCKIREVEYLKYPHRHNFGIVAVMDVSHANRDVEFIELQHKIRTYLAIQYFDDTTQLHVFGARSCEMLARELITTFGLCKCEVNEDNENGAILTVV